MAETQYMGEYEAFEVLSDVVGDGTDEALALNSLHAHIRQLWRDRGTLGDEVSRLRAQVEQLQRERELLAGAMCGWRGPFATVQTAKHEGKS